MLSIMMIFYLFLPERLSNCICVQIDMDKLAGSLPLHLTAVLISSDRNEAVFKYLLCGIRLLHSLCDLAPRLPKLDQVNISNPYGLINNFYVLLLVFFVFLLSCGKGMLSRSSIFSKSIKCLYNIFCVLKQKINSVFMLLVYPIFRD